nr:Flp1 family type IVb pilin [uncultured Blautia sp.]
MKIMKVFRDFYDDESGITVIEIVLVLVVLIGLVIIFKKQLTSLIQSILSKITSQSNSI